MQNPLGSMQLGQTKAPHALQLTKACENLLHAIQIPGKLSQLLVVLLDIKNNCNHVHQNECSALREIIFYLNP